MFRFASIARLSTVILSGFAAAPSSAATYYYGATLTVSHIGAGGTYGGSWYEPPPSWLEHGLDEETWWALPEYATEIATGGTLLSGGGVENFGEVVVGEGSVAKTYTITGRGREAATLLSISVNGEGFVLDHPSFETPLSYGDSVSFTVRMTAEQAGRFDAQVVVEVGHSGDYYSGYGWPEEWRYWTGETFHHVIGLAGAAVTVSSIQIPQRLEFPATAVGAARTQGLLIENTSPLSTLTISLQPTSMRFQASPASDWVTVPPGESREIPVKFFPHRTGVIEDTLTLQGWMGLRAFSRSVTLQGEGEELAMPVLADWVSGSLSTEAPFDAIKEYVAAVRNLPPGVTYNYATGGFIGRPRAAGTYLATVTLRNPAGSSERTFSIQVKPLPAQAIGEFASLVLPPDPAEPGPLASGGVLTVSSQPDGTLGGSLTIGKEVCPFIGRIEAGPAEPQGSEPVRSSVTVERTNRRGGPPLVLQLEFRPDDDLVAPGLTGTVVCQGSVGVITGGWHQEKTSQPGPNFLSGERRLHLALANRDGDEPAGQGYATIKLAKNGQATWSGVLPDGEKFNGAGYVSPQGGLIFYQPLPYPSGGCLMLALETEIHQGLVRIITSENRPAGYWIKHPTLKAGERSYPGGLDIALTVYGAEYRAPAKGVLLFGATATPEALDFSLSGADVTESAALGQAIKGDFVAFDATLQKSHKVEVAATVSGLKIRPTFTVTTGLAKGSLVLAETVRGKPQKRTLSFSGLYIPDLDDPSQSNIAGFFLLPDIATAGQAPAKAPIRSGLFLLTTDDEE